MSDQGSLLLAWQLKDSCVLIVGGGEVASHRLADVLAAGALVTLIAPRIGLHPLVLQHIPSPRITYYDRTFDGPDDLTDVDMVLTAIDDVEASREIHALCRIRRIPVNVADIPPLCDFYFGAQVRRGPLQVMISTNGNGPKLASLIKERIEDALPENVGEATEKVGILRRRLRQRAPGVGGDLGRRRMKWISSVCEKWSIDDLSRLDEDAIEHLLDGGWERNVIPRPSQILQSRGFPALKEYWRRPPQFGMGLVVGFLAGALMVLIGHQRG